jgi:hypothetical protein
MGMVILWMVGCAGPDAVEPPADLGADTAPPPSCAPVDVVDLAATGLGEGICGVRLDLALSAAGTAQVACTLVDAPPLWRQLVSFGSDWRVEDEVDPGESWASPAHDDSGWDLGTGPFAAGDPAQAALDEAAGGRTVYYRTTFEVDDPSAITLLFGTTHRDDGLAVWINGQEAARDNLPAGPLTPATAALASVEGAAELELHQLVFDPADLVAGSNVLAVEVHPVVPGAADADTSFDLRLAALVQEPLPEPPEIHVADLTEASTAASLELFGLLAGATYTCVARSGCPGAEATVDLHTDPLPRLPPPLAQRPGSEASWGAYTLFNHQRPCAGDYSNRLYVVDPDGRVRWQLELPVEARSSIDIESVYLGDGTFLWGGGEELSGTPQIVALDHEIRHQAAYPGAEDDVYHHDLEWADGQITGLVASTVTGGTPGAEGIRLLTHDVATQAVTWEWDAQRAVDQGQLPPPDWIDPYHANSFASVVDADGPGVYVTLLSTNTVIRVDQATGDISWTLGPGGDFVLVDESGSPLPEDAWLDGIHALDIFGDHLLLYDNGRDTLRSQVMELTLDIPSRRAALTWTWTEFGWYEPIWGDADELPNGNVLIAMAHDYCVGANPSHPGALVEVDRATDDVLWRLDFLDSNDATYRSQRIDGCALFANTRFCPELASKVSR